MYLNEESIIGTGIDKFNLKHNSDKHFTRTLKHALTTIAERERERERERAKNVIPYSVQAIKSFCCRIKLRTFGIVR